MALNKLSAQGWARHDKVTAEVPNELEAGVELIEPVDAGGAAGLMNLAAAVAPYNDCVHVQESLDEGHEAERTLAVVSNNLASAQAKACKLLGDKEGHGQ